GSPFCGGGAARRGNDLDGALEASGPVPTPADRDFSTVWKLGAGRSHLRGEREAGGPPARGGSGTGTSRLVDRRTGSRDGELALSRQGLLLGAYSQRPPSRQRPFRGRRGVCASLGSLADGGRI